MPPRGRQRTRRYNNNAGALTIFWKSGEPTFRKIAAEISRLKREPVRRASRVRYVRFMRARDPDGSDGPSTIDLTQDAE
jgi:hypothetical protein